MQSINFNCPHCGNLMAVGENLLGRNVRCPHPNCGKIVKAPVAAGQAAIAVAAPPSPSESQKSLPIVIPQNTESHESIFGEVHHEDIFESASAPKPTFVLRPSGNTAPTTSPAIKLPPMSPSPPPPAQNETGRNLEQTVPTFIPTISSVPSSIMDSIEPISAVPPSLQEPTFQSTPNSNSSNNPTNEIANQDFDFSELSTKSASASPPPPSMAQNIQPVLSTGVPTQNMDWKNDYSEPGAPFYPSSVPSGASSRTAKSEPPVSHDPNNEPERVISKRSASKKSEPVGKTSILTWVLLIYGVIATIGLSVFAAKALMSQSKEAHPFDAIPDVFGHYEKADRKKTSHNILPHTDWEVPKHLRVRLNDTLTVGELQVTPLAVERKRVNVLITPPKGKPNTVPMETVLLRMKVKNISQSTWFHPNDPAFWREPKRGESVYTALLIDKTPHYGPFQWPALVRYTIEGYPSQDDQPLRPGEERETFVCTGPKSDTIRSLETYKGELLWRVQLRQGLVSYTDPQGRTGEISATTVIGVPFTAEQIVRN